MSCEEARGRQLARCWKTSAVLRSLDLCTEDFGKPLKGFQRGNDMIPCLECFSPDPEVSFLSFDSELKRPLFGKAFPDLPI